MATLTMTMTVIVMRVTRVVSVTMVRMVIMMRTNSGMCMEQGSHQNVLRKAQYRVVGSHATPLAQSKQGC